MPKPRRTPAEVAYDEYVKEQYPEEGEGGSAFIETCAIEHFTYGWEAAMKKMKDRANAKA